MSRHRFVRDMDIGEELDDDALYDEEEEDMTDEQRELLEDAVEKVKAIIGDERTSGFQHSYVIDVVWNNHFDIARSVSALVDERDRRAAAEERKDYVPSDEKDLPQIPESVEDDGSDSYEYSSSQSQSQFMGFTGAGGRRLSRITERTEDSQSRSSRRDVKPHRRAPTTTSTLSYGLELASVSPTTTYGDVIESHMMVDPNDLPPSPTASALRYLSISETFQTPEPSESAESTTPRMQSPGPPMPPLETIPDIPDQATRSTRHPQVLMSISSSSGSSSATAKPNKPPTDQSLPQSASQSAKTSTPKMSKLASLANSRSGGKSKSNSEASASLESASFHDSGSAATFPALHPSQSSRPPSNLQQRANASATSITPPSDKLQYSANRATMATMMTTTDSHQEPKRPHAPTPTQGSRPVVQMTPPTVTPSAPVSTKSTPPNVVVPSARLPSKLALLAQAKASSPIPKPSQPKVLGPPHAHTEYLRPTSNTSVMTTAITTYIQTPDNMLALSRAELPPSYPPPLSSSASQTGSKMSKLAAKSKKSQFKATSTSSDAIDLQPSSMLINPIYRGDFRGSSRALPSAFASVLVDDNLNLMDRKGRTDSSVDLDEKQRRKAAKLALLPSHLTPSSHSSNLAFNGPSPDDIVMNARHGTAFGKRTSLKSSSSQPSTPAKAREKSQKITGKQNQGTRSVLSSASTSRASSPIPPSSPIQPSTSTPARRFGPSMLSKSTVDQQSFDISALNLDSKQAVVEEVEVIPKVRLAREKLLEEVQVSMEGVGKKRLNLVVIGHVDAGKSTLMGRLLYELGYIDEKRRITNERASSKMGKSSFSWAWELDGTLEERQRGVTMDIAQQSITTSNRQITILDAPGHRDFIPNMISGANQADCALLVVDASTGEFEAGFHRGGQTREHLVLVRSLGVNQVITAINKLDQVQWDKDRFEEICDLLRPFLLQSGFSEEKSWFVPVGAISGVNLVERTGPESKALAAWYTGPTLVDLLDKLEPPGRPITGPLRFPISNVFRAPTGGTAVSGRVCSGVLQVGERLRILPGDESASVKSIEMEDNNVQWAAAGSNATLYLAMVDPIHLKVGSVLCPPSNLIPLAVAFNARIIVFDVQLPIIAGSSIDLFHHSQDVPATISKIMSILDRTTGAVIKQKPRVLPKSTSAEVQITLRTTSISDPSSRVQAIPIEPFAVNKDMGRILIRRSGETIAAGIVLEIVDTQP